MNSELDFKSRFLCKLELCPTKNLASFFWSSWLRDATYRVNEPSLVPNLGITFKLTRGLTTIKTSLQISRVSFQGFVYNSITLTFFCTHIHKSAVTKC
jgi:hypothetical protein